MLKTHDRYGNRIDEVEFHPAWHKLMKLGVEHELHALPWRTEQSGAHAARAALYMTAMQAEAGFCLPDHDDLRRAAGAARPTGAAGRVGPAGNGHEL